MKEFVLVEFMCVHAESLIMAEAIQELKDEFILDRTDTSEEQEEDDTWGTAYYHVWGKISSEAASFIRLQNDFLAQRMRISYIPEDLKDKYRTKK